MNIFAFEIWGIPIWMYLFLLCGIGVFLVAFFWEKLDLIGFYYRKRFPEKVIKVVMHYKSGYYKVFWRLVPNNKIMKVKRKEYIYDSQEVKKELDFYAVKQDKQDKPLIMVFNNIMAEQTKNGKPVFKLDGLKKYEFEEKYQIKRKGKKYPEIHYMYNIPNPIRFDFAYKKVEFSAHSLKEFKDNDLFEKLMRLSQQATMMTLLLIIVIINAGISGFLLAKTMGWIE